MSFLLKGLVYEDGFVGRNSCLKNNSEIKTSKKSHSGIFFFKTGFSLHRKTITSSIFSFNIKFLLNQGILVQLFVSKYVSKQII